MSESWLPCPPAIPLAPATRPLDRLARGVLHRAVATLARGQIVLSDADGSKRFGAPDPETGLRARVAVHDPRFYADVLAGGALGAAESWIAGRWTSDDPTALIRILLRNPESMAGLDGPWARLATGVRDALYRMRRNTRRASRRQIAAHYDLGNEFFALFLDPTMTYSSGVFEHPEASLEEASVAKIERLCRWLDLRPTDHLLEIGTGWGALAIHAATRFGCRVTTTTLSREQAEWARERVAEAGVADRVEVRIEDYRDLRGRFDKLVSVEMIEAVGHAHFETYFRRCAELLEPDGLMALQAIVIDDAHYEQARRHEDFIKRYVFPGGCLPSMEVMTRHLARATDLRVRRVEDITAHYAETLRRWRSRFHAHADRVRALGYPDPFLRMWDFYLAYCEAGFEERHIGTVQMLLARSEWREGRPFAAPPRPARPGAEGSCIATPADIDGEDRLARPARLR